MAVKTVHFKGLTELRGIAAMVVVISHIDQFHFLFGFSPFGWSKTGLATDSVTLFFVLSGFLITYLLIKEKEATGTINIKHFYIRRILRIWPVYYLSVIISLLMVYFGILSSPQNLPLSILLYILLLANLVYVLGFSIRSINPLWSVGVEEQFYLIWPWLVKNSNIQKSLYLIIAIYLFIKIVFWHLQKEGGEYALILLTRIDCMAIGGLFSLFFHRSKNLNLFYSFQLQLASCLVIISPIFYSQTFIYNIEIEIKAIAYGIVIINVATNEETFIKVTNRLLKFLGKISYGLYCYHMIIIFFLSYFYHQDRLLGIGNNTAFMILLIVCSSVTFSFLSFLLMESPMLKLKKHYSSHSVSS